MTNGARSLFDEIDANTLQLTEQRTLFAADAAQEWDDEVPPGTELGLRACYSLQLNPCPFTLEVRTDGRGDVKISPADPGNHAGRVFWGWDNFPHETKTEPGQPSSFRLGMMWLGLKGFILPHPTDFDPEHFGDFFDTCWGNNVLSSWRLYPTRLEAIAAIGRIDADPVFRDLFGTEIAVRPPNDLADGTHGRRGLIALAAQDAYSVSHVHARRPGERFWSSLCGPEAAWVTFRTPASGPPICPKCRGMLAIGGVPFDIGAVSES